MLAPIHDYFDNSNSDPETDASAIQFTDEINFLGTVRLQIQRADGTDSMLRGVVDGRSLLLLLDQVTAPTSAVNQVGNGTDIIVIEAQRAIVDTATATINIRQGTLRCGSMCCLTLGITYFNF